MTRKVLGFMTPRNFWSIGLLGYGVLMVATFWVETVGSAMIIVAALGVPWAVNCWVRHSPFILSRTPLIELLNE